MKSFFNFAVMIYCCIMMVSCAHSKERQMLIGTWESTYESFDTDDNVDINANVYEKSTYKDNGDTYENGTITYTYNVVDVDFTTVVKLVYEYNTAGTWSIVDDEIILERSSANYEHQSTQFNLYDTESGQEMVPNTDYKNEIINSIKESLDDSFKSLTKELKEPGTLKIIAISDKEMQLEDKDGITTYKRVK